MSVARLAPRLAGAVRARTGGLRRASVGGGLACRPRFAQRASRRAGGGRRPGGRAGGLGGAASLAAGGAGDCGRAGAGVGASLDARDGGGDARAPRGTTSESEAVPHSAQRRGPHGRVAVAPRADDADLDNVIRSAAARAWTSTVGPSGPAGARASAARGAELAGSTSLRPRRAPASTLRANARPPCASAIRRTSARPSP